MVISLGNCKNLGEKRAAVPQIEHEVSRDGTRGSEARSQRLIA
jgi:hypothetical protein